MKIAQQWAALVLLIAFAAPAQQKTKPTIVAEGGTPDDYASSRVLYWNTKKDAGAGEFAFNYGRPVWNKEYEDPAKFDAMTKGKVWRMGANFWTNLETQVPIKISGKAIPVGYYYLGVHRSDDGSKWSLAFIDPAKVRTATLDAFNIQEASIGFEAPLIFGKADSTVQKLTVNLSYKEPDIKNVTLKIAWGNFVLSAPIQATVTE